MGNMTFQIKAQNKHDLAHYFRSKAAELEILGGRLNITKKRSLELKSEARGWRYAADCLEETTFTDYELSNPE